jgi:DNA adenine methylase
MTLERSFTEIIHIMEQHMQKLFAYPGGKWPIRNQVIAAFPNHLTYVDVFGGAASILLAKQHSKGEIFNDKNEEIMNFFRVVKHRPAELAEAARHWIHSRKLWLETKAADKPVDELQRALRFWILLADSFGARGENFGTSRTGIHSVTHARMHLNIVADRMKDVHIECLDFSKIINAYDSFDTFFYCDPPYPDTRGGSTNYDLLTEAEWKKLRDMLSSIKGQFLLSSNDHPMVRDLFKKYHVKEIAVSSTLARNKETNIRQELLISNYPVQKTDGISQNALNRRRGANHRTRMMDDRSPIAHLSKKKHASVS